jgi:hypothetical protein
MCLPECAVDIGPIHSLFIPPRSFRVDIEESSNSSDAYRAPSPGILTIFLRLAAPAWMDS